MDFDTFLQQTRKALTRRSVGSLNFLYETKVAAAGFQLMWKKHLADEDIRVNLGVVMLKECADASVVTRLIFEHAISISSDLQGKIGQLESENERLATERASALKVKTWVPWVRFNNMPALVQIMAWHWTGHKP